MCLKESNLGGCDETAHGYRMIYRNDSCVVQDRIHTLFIHVLQIVVIQLESEDSGHVPLNVGHFVTVKNVFMFHN